MILTKNRLKKIKFKDDDEMLYYLKYSHLEPIREDDILGIQTSDKMTQAPERMDNFAQTNNKVMVDKETDTFDELNKMDINSKYVLEGFDKSFNNNKQTQVNSFLVKELEPKTPPSSDSQDDDEGSFSRNLSRGLRIAQLTGNAMLTALNIADTVGNAVLSPVIGSAIDYAMSSPTNEAEEEAEEEQEEEAEEDEAEDASAEASRGYRDPEMRDRSRSRDGSENDDLGNRLLSRGASRSRSVTPSSTPASSAKTTPRKKI